MEFPKSDLMDELARRGGDAARVAALARMVGSLERMARFLAGREDVDRFKRGFTDEYWRIIFGRSDPDIEEIAAGLSGYYKQLHFYSPHAENRARVSMLFDEEHLRTLTRETYDRIRAQWLAAARV